MSKMAYKTVIYLQAALVQIYPTILRCGFVFSQNAAADTLDFENKCSAVADMGDRLATIDMGRS